MRLNLLLLGNNADPSRVPFYAKITGMDMVRGNVFCIYRVGFIGFFLLCEVYASGDTGLVSLAMEPSLWGNGGHKGPN